MEEKENMVDFDLSKLKLYELIELYEKVTDFQKFLDGQIKETESKEEANE